MGLALLVTPWAALAFAAIIGAGALRRGGPLVVSAAAAAIIALPALAPAGYVKRERRALVVFAALGTWSLCVLAGFPVFFPGERSEAVATGLAVTFVPDPLARAARAVEHALPTLGRHSTPPPPAARPLEAPTPAGKQQEELKTESTGTTLTVAARVVGPEGAAVDLRLVFDTGASLTTLPRRVLDAIGVKVPADAPEVTLGTASGEIKARLALVDRVSLGGLEVRWVTVAVCDACAGRSFDGLLGLNVAGQFLVTLDGAHNRIVLERRNGFPNRMLDVEPWLTVRAGATTWLDGRVEVEVHVWNGSRRPVGAVELAIRCDQAFLVELHDLPPEATSSAVVRLPRGAKCEDDYTTPLERAAW